MPGAVAEQTYPRPTNIASPVRMLPTRLHADTVLSLERSALQQDAEPATTMASKHPQHTEDLQFRVLKLLQERPDLSQRDLATRLGVSNGKLHYCIRALIDRGLVKLESFANSKHHLRYAYLLTPSGAAEKAAMTSRFLRRKIAEYEALRIEIESLQAELHSKSLDCEVQLTEISRPNRANGIG